MADDQPAGPLGPPRDILVIKHGALGDFVMATGAMKAIRARHLSDRLVLLTASPFAELGRRCGLFDEVWTDDRPGPLAVRAWLGLRRKLRVRRFARIYDLQTSPRTGYYFRLLGPGARPEWSGIAPGCSHPHSNPDRRRMHTIDRLADQMAMAGIDYVPPPGIEWLHADISRFDLPARIALLVPGGSAERPEKRWPAEHFAQLAWRLRQAEITPVLIGTDVERRVADEIADACPAAITLVGETGLDHLATLGRRAAAAIGNDTGPMHLMALAGCRTVVLFSQASDPSLCAPRGPDVTILRHPSLTELTVEEVVAAARLLA